MNEHNRAIEEYIQRYADMYCEGDVAVAAEHKIVQETVKEIDQQKEK